MSQKQATSTKYLPSLDKYQQTGEKAKGFSLPELNGIALFSILLYKPIPKTGMAVNGFNALIAVSAYRFKLPNHLR